MHDQSTAPGRIAVPLVRDPKAFLFDEPLSNLDAQLRNEMRTEIKKLHLRPGKTIIYVTHDQVEAMTLADRIAVLSGGKVMQYDTPDEIYNRPAAQFAAGFTGSLAMNFASADIANDGASAVVGGVSVTLPENLRTASAAYRGKSVVLGIRPEDISVI